MEVMSQKLLGRRKPGKLSVLESEMKAEKLLVIAFTYYSSGFSRFNLLKAHR